MNNVSEQLKEEIDRSKKQVTAVVYDKGDHVSLQFWGWAIVLNEDGTWFWEDTSGG